MMDYQENYEEEVVRNPDNIVILESHANHFWRAFSWHAIGG